MIKCIDECNTKADAVELGQVLFVMWPLYNTNKWSEVKYKQRVSGYAKLIFNHKWFKLICFILKTGP